MEEIITYAGLGFLLSFTGYFVICYIHTIRLKIEINNIIDKIMDDKTYDLLLKNVQETRDDVKTLSTRMNNLELKVNGLVVKSSVIGGVAATFITIGLTLFKAFVS